MKKTLKIIQNNKFLRSVLILSSGTIVGQFLMIMVLPILTRIYSPESFGLLGIYVSLIAILSVASCLRLELAIPLQDNDADAVNLLVLSLCFATIAAIVMGIIIAIYHAKIIILLKQPSMQSYLWMIPFGAWFLAIYAAIQLWAIRKGHFKHVARTQVSRAVGSSGMQTTMGLFNNSAFGLLIGYMFYGGIGATGLFRVFWENDRHLLSSITAKTLKMNLHAQRRFPYFSVPEALLDSAANNFPLVIIGGIAGANEAGFLLLAQRITSIPVGLLGSNISRVYLSEAGQKYREKKLGSFTRKTMRNLFFVGIIPFSLLMVTAPFIFPILFGENWSRTGVMISWMVPYMLTQFVTSPVSTILHATNNQRTALTLQAFGFIVIIGAIFTASQMNSKYAFEFFAVSSIIYYLTYFGTIYALTKKIERI